MKKITQNEMAVQMDLMEAQLQRVDSMLVLAKRLLAESVADTARIEYLERQHAAGWSFEFGGTTITDKSIRTAIDRLMDTSGGLAV